MLAAFTLGQRFRHRWPHAVMIIPIGGARAAVPKDARPSSCKHNKSLISLGASVAGRRVVV